MRIRFTDRGEAGQQLAAALSAYAHRDDLIVLALPRGGVPVAYEVAKALKAPLDLLIVRKLGLPGQPELAMGAIATGGQIVLNEELVHQLQIPGEYINVIAQAERQELERRERAYRGDRPVYDVYNRIVILIDDGIATGSTMRVAIKALRQRHPARIVVAIPTAPPDIIEVLAREADEVVCLMTPMPFAAVGQWYENFSQVSDEEVCELLKQYQEALETMHGQ